MRAALDDVGVESYAAIPARGYETIILREVAAARRAAWQYLNALEIEDRHVAARLAELRERLARAEETDLPGLARDVADTRRTGAEGATAWGRL